MKNHSFFRKSHKPYLPCKIENIRYHTRDTNIVLFTCRWVFSSMHLHFPFRVYASEIEGRVVHRKRDREYDRVWVSKGSFNVLHTLWVYIYLSTIFLWVSKFNVKFRVGEHHFRNYRLYVSFEKFSCKLVFLFVLLNSSIFGILKKPLAFEIE